MEDDKSKADTFSLTLTYFTSQLLAYRPSGMYQPVAAQPVFSLCKTRNTGK